MKSLKELREYNNLTQKEVAQHIGVSDRVYSYYEKGRTLPAKYVKPLANLFGISCDEFLENTENPLVWEKEFGCIENTERLELPTWETIPFERQNSYVKKFTIKGNCDYFGRLVVDNNVIRVMGLVQGCLFEEYFNEIRSKENYTIACKIARDLFLGEKK